MLEAFKLLPTGIKIGWAVGLLIALASLLGAVGYTQYQRGLNVSKVEISKYEGKVKGLNGKLAVANGKTTVKYVTQYLDRKVEVEKIVYKNRDVIKTVVPRQYYLSTAWVYSYDQGVKGEPVDPDKAKDATPSQYMDVDALQVANSNSGVCLSNEIQLESLQAWVKEVHENGQSVTAK